MDINNLVSEISSHRCCTHPAFQNWAKNRPSPESVGALFHQIASFCDATRPGHNLPEGLASLGLAKERQLLDAIVESETNHGPELATMAGHILNRAYGRTVCPDLGDEQAVEAVLKRLSDQLLGALPGYDAKTGLMPQTRRARAVFELRKQTDRESVLRSLGATLALEMVSNRQLIPGEKHALVDSGLYGASLDEGPMHYLNEHFGETGAESMHEQHAIDAIASVLTSGNAALVKRGADEFLDALVALWDLLDSALLQSGEECALSEPQQRGAA